MFNWRFWCIDNGGKRQCFEVKAGSKADATRKAFDRARKHAAGDIHAWSCDLIRAF